jgi:phosphoglycolate phosphatase
MQYQCLLFDLDGTLVDSRVDLTNAVNLMLQEFGHRPLPDSRVINFIGEGARLLVERSLREVQEDLISTDEVDRALEVFRRHYRAHLLDQTHLYPEVEETLAALPPLPKAVVTNKPHDLTVALLEGIGLRKYFSVVLGGDSLPERKPSPMMLAEAARLSNAEPGGCLMIGDSRIDIAAGKAAGMKTCGYIAGFRGRTELAEAGADYLIERFGELRFVVEDSLIAGSGKN